MSKRTLYLVTRAYPLIKDHDSCFISPEIPFLEERFDIKYIIVSNQPVSQNSIPQNCTYHNESFSFLNLLFCKLRFFFRQAFWEEFAILLKERKLTWKSLSVCQYYGACAEYFYRAIRKKEGFDSESEAIIYFYWWDYRTLGFTMNRRRHPKLKVIARCHGGDLYDEEAWECGRQFFKWSMAKVIDRVFFISEHGRNYILKRHGIVNDGRFVVSRLGVKSVRCETVQNNARSSLHVPFILVSCSYMNSFKRINLIIEGLSLIKDRQIRWVHFGGGELESELESLAKRNLSDNVIREWRGNVENEEILNYYLSTYPDCFITTTRIEGCPVSVMEALNCGIPIIATAVTEIPHMVKGNGILLSSDPNPQEIADAIRAIMDMPLARAMQLRRESRKLYEADYDVDVNHSRFASILEELYEK